LIPAIAATSFGPQILVLQGLGELFRADYLAFVWLFSLQFFTRTAVISQANSSK
jgi:hypothetical protein